MNKQKGFILPSPIMLYGALGALAIIVGLSVAVKVQSSRLASTKAEYAGFVAQTKAIGEIQEAKAKIENDRLTKLKKEADNENAIARTKLADLAKRLSSNRSSRGYLPIQAASSASPTVATFDRANLERALRDFDGEVAGIVVEGDQAIIDLNTAKDWAKELSK